MRLAYNDAGLVHEDGNLIGVSLGYDFCAEHEFGIENLLDAFDAHHEKKLGVDQHTINHVPDDYGMDESRRILGFPLKDAVRTLADTHKSEELVCAWSGRSFGIRFPEGAEKDMRDMHEAIMRKDALIVMGAPTMAAFANSRLCIVIKSRLPKEQADAMREADLDHKRLLKASEKTGIEKRVKDAGLKFFALSPEWVKGNPRETDTRHPVIYWLNPWEQRRNNAGWFTVEELDAWTRGEGPVLKRLRA